ncbi:hypothetical protein MKW94_014930 [Papaver nudicaule]|uniref:Uncharacterized protein n=1 Tax=Papaver nudicaule TaxID=74823 RepID=A0AA41V5U8_PAPNU|nr:hypothetical protein [Papaver nudicaule]
MRQIHCFLYSGVYETIHKVMTLRLVNADECESLFMKIWAMLFFKIKKLEEGTTLEIFNDTPKTKEELHEKLRPSMRKEVMELLKKKKASVVDKVVDVKIKIVHPKCWSCSNPHWTFMLKWLSESYGGRFSY